MTARDFAKEPRVSTVERLERLLASTPEDGRLLVARLDVPELSFRAFFDPLLEGAFWIEDDHASVCAGFGSALELGELSKHRDLRRVYSYAKDKLCAAHFVADTEHPVSVLESVRLVGGLAFSERGGRDDWAGFGPGRFEVPRFCFERQPDGSRALTFISADRDGGALEELEGILERGSAAPRPVMDLGSGPLTSCSEVPEEQYKRMIEVATSEIERGFFEKVVLARSEIVSRPESFDVAASMARLDKHPSLTRFAFCRNGRVFLGSTPETLVRVSGPTRRFHTHALAGSAAVHEGGTALLTSAKDRQEHDYVARFIVDRLGSISASVEVDAEPAVLELPNVLHLETRVRGQLEEGVDIVDAALRLHPTPAVLGTPSEDARAFIDDHEDLDRGWYAGAVGWLDLSGSGALFVALRSALIHGAEARLFAGSGIVRASNPELELNETSLKLKSMRVALGAGE